MDKLHAMSETEQDLLLVGQSNSGNDCARRNFTAISLAQITSAFVLAGSDDDECELDFTDSLLFMKVIDDYIDEVGRTFAEAEKRRSS